MGKIVFQVLLGISALAMVFLLGITFSNIVMPHFTANPRNQTNGGIVFMVILWIAFAAIYIQAKKSKTPRSDR